MPAVGLSPGGCDCIEEHLGSIYATSQSRVVQLTPDSRTGGVGQFTSLGITSSRLFGILDPWGLAVGHVHGLGLWADGSMAPLTEPGPIVFRACSSESRPGMILASFRPRRCSGPRNRTSNVVADGLPDYPDTVADEPSGRIWIGTPSRGLFVAESLATRVQPASQRFGPVPEIGPVLVTRAGRSIVALGSRGAYALDRVLDPASSRFPVFRRAIPWQSQTPMSAATSGQRSHR